MTNYIALARKWRPKQFSELVGHDLVKQALIQSLSCEKLHHAYLFTGTRGVGKTTIARLLAKALNCEQGISASPCGVCTICTDIDAGQSLDVIEIDAASKTRVEDTRELLDNVHYHAGQARFKIYLIDEVHMLSQHSFNALLKTLEEPPAHVKFLLATTDPQKLPATIISRCLQFYLRPISDQHIFEQLQRVFSAEHIAADDDALRCIAERAKGSMRDALSLGEQIAASSSGNMTLTDVLQTLGLSRQDHLEKILLALLARDSQALHQTVLTMAQEGLDFEDALNQLLSLLHKISLAQQLSDNLDYFALPATLKSTVTGFAATDVQLFYDIALKGKQDLQLAPNPLIGFEMVMLRLLAFQPRAYQAPKKAAAQIEHLEAAPTTFIAEQATVELTEPRPAPKPITEELAHYLDMAPEPHAQAPEEPVSISVEAPPVQATQTQMVTEPEFAMQNITNAKPVPQTPPDPNQDWLGFIQFCRFEGIAESALLHSVCKHFDGRSLYLELEPGHDALFTKACVARIEEKLAQVFGKTCRIHLENRAKLDNTPAVQKANIASEQQEQRLQAFQSDPAVREICERFDARLFEESVSDLDA